VEEPWTISKYSVNNEEIKDNENEKDRNMMKNEQFVTQL
jgi:hypothetical protein